MWDYTSHFFYWFILYTALVVQFIEFIRFQATWSYKISCRYTILFMTVSFRFYRHIPSRIVLNWHDNSFLWCMLQRVVFPSRNMG
ncbi:hypothetical protein BDV35DRAFT_370255, partial [Aspergillus flavus]